MVVGVLLGWPSLPVQAVQPAIVGGSPTTVNDHPWQVALLVSGIAPGQVVLCGGSLVTDSWVLTAAHCVENRAPADVTVHTGVTWLSQRSEQTLSPVASVVLHPQADTSAFVNDLALVQLATPVVLGPERQPIALPVGQDPLAWPPVGTTVTLTGWGVLAEGGPSPDQLQSATATVLADSGGGCGQYGAAYIGTSQMCVGLPTGGVDTCQGDSGGPLVADLNGVRTLIGVTSVGQGCGQAAYPGLYSRTAVALPWIQQVANVPMTVPSPPVGVTAIAQRDGRALVTWQPMAGVTSFTVTASPGGVTCTSAAAACQFGGLRPGTSYAFTVQGFGPQGPGGASQPSPAVVAVHATGRKGTQLRAAKVVRLAGLQSASRIASRTASTCRVVGRTVQLRRAGLCHLVVTGSRRAHVYVGIVA